MSQWADFLISAVRYNSEHAHIIKVIQHQDSVTSVGSGVEVLRTLVIQNIKLGLKYATIYSNGSQWKLGQRIILDTIKGIEYIKTVPDNITADNLGELPEF